MTSKPMSLSGRPLMTYFVKKRKPGQGYASRTEHGNKAIKNRLKFIGLISEKIKAKSRLEQK